jgi:hypothetical protein
MSEWTHSEYTVHHMLHLEASGIAVSAGYDWSSQLQSQMVVWCQKSNLNPALCIQLLKGSEEA